MKRSLQLLVEQSERDKEKLGQRMAQVQQRLQRSVQTRDSLTAYVLDYRQQQLVQADLTGERLRSEGRFIGRIEGVLQQQSADVAKLQSELDRISADLMALRVQQLRYEALLTRIANQEEQVRNQRDQKATDELSVRRAAARILEARRRPRV